jgi:hypothetical protein
MRTTPCIGRPPPDLNRLPPRRRMANPVRPRPWPSAARGSGRPMRTSAEPRRTPSATEARRPSATDRSGRLQWAAAGGRLQPCGQARPYNFFNFLIKNQFLIKRSKTLIK